MVQDSPPRRVLVTGATGNVGTALLRRLAAEGVAVSGVARRVPAGSSPVRWHGIDLAAGWATGALREGMEGVDAVVHLAWKIQPSRPGAARDAMRRTNVEGTRAVVTAAREAGVPHLVHASSVGVYAPVPQDAQRSGDKPVVDESWPRTGVPSSPYSRDKVAAEDLLDELVASGPGGGIAVARVRPGLVLQREAGSEIARYFGGPLLPAGLVGGLDLAGRRRKLPVLPLPDGFVAPVVHADDLADGIWRVLATRATGAFNAAADEPVGPDDLARQLGAHRRVRVPLSVVRRAAEISWHGRLQPTDPGWVDLAAGAPLQDSSRLKALGWAPRVSATAALADLVAGMRGGADGGTPALAPRRLLSGRWAA